MSGQRLRQVLVYGLGRSGRAVCKLLAAQGYDISVIDERVAKLLGDGNSHQLSKNEDACLVAELGLDVYGSLEQLKQTSPNLLDKITTCIAAPGVPWQHTDLENLRTQNIETIGEVEWVYRSVMQPANVAKPSSRQFIGITGTAGKTSTTQWISDMLCQAGQVAPAGGNIGRALAEVVQDDAVQEADNAILVTEMSSFQLERCPSLRPNIAIILNLGVDHIDRHGSLEAYHSAKQNLISNLESKDVFIYHADDPQLAAWAAETSAQAFGFSLNNRQADAYYDADKLVLHGDVLLSTTDLHIHGQHQHTNALAVALAGSACGLSREEICAGLQAFEGVAGRYSHVASVNGVQFIEDSIATRTLAVKAALEATPAPIVWLVGGQDKGAEVDSLRQLVADKVSLLLAMGEAGPSFARAFEDVTDVQIISEPDGQRALEEACTLGYQHLMVNTEQLDDKLNSQSKDKLKGSVLLAPLAASFDQFADYKARAKAFRQSVHELAASEHQQENSPKKNSEQKNPSAKNSEQENLEQNNNQQQTSMNTQTSSTKHQKEALWTAS